ncbi:MAG: FixH family protein [Betaproteobacteria bacterium]|nr:FixH family protein [Betaproteobacteria bacterium]
MTTNSQTLDNQPWYKCGWPWFLFGLPAISVIVGISLYVAANYFHVDSIVYGDYAKDGKAVELRDEKFAHARSLGLSAHATVRDGEISIKMSAAQEKDLPTALYLTIVHPTQDRFDQRMLLQREQDGVYSGAMSKPLDEGRWVFQLGDETQTWSMTGIASIPAETEVSIEPFQAGL